MRATNTILTILLLAGAGVAAYFIYKTVTQDKDEKEKAEATAQRAKLNNMSAEQLESAEQTNTMIQNGEIAGPPQMILKGMQQKSKAVKRYFTERGNMVE